MWVYTHPHPHQCWLAGISQWAPQNILFELAQHCLMFELPKNHSERSGSFYHHTTHLKPAVNCPICTELSRPVFQNKLQLLKNRSKLMTIHTSLEVWLPQTKWTLNATYLGSSGTYLGVILYLLDNKKTSLFWVGSQHVQPIQPKFGGFFCLCTTGPPKRLVNFFSNVYEMKPK